MKKSEIQVGRHYTVKVIGKIVTVEVLREFDRFIGGRYVTRWHCRNLTTGREIIVRSAQRFRCEEIGWER